jgi:lathosterol oxidase
MDLALELLDTYALDWIYSAILPAQPAPYNLKDGINNSTSADIQSASPWQYKPSSNIISFTPTEAAYASQWTRDNVYRQTLSLFFITW